MTKTKIWVQTEGSFLILLAVMLLLLPLQWVIAAVIAASVHEVFHFFAIRLLGGNIYGLRFGLNGARMEVESMPPTKEMTAAFAGPIGSALLILLAKWMPRLAICGFVHCIFNLLPLFPLDGGRVLKGLFRIFWPRDGGERAFAVSQQILMWGMGFLCILAALKLGVFPTLLGVGLILRQRRKRTV